MHDTLEKLKNLALRRHYWNEDAYYSCPKDKDGCDDPAVPKDICNCGADSHNAKVEAVIKELEEELATIYAFRRKGQPHFVTCEQGRYNELSQKSQFETIMFYGPASKIYKEFSK